MNSACVIRSSVQSIVYMFVLSSPGSVKERKPGTFASRQS